MPTLKRAIFGPKLVSTDADIQALIADSKPHGATTLHHVMLSIEPVEPADQTPKKPGVAFAYSGYWSGISFWF